MSDFPVEQYPILTPGQMNPWNLALSSGLDTYQNIQKAAYAPAQMQADIYSKYAAPMQSMTALLTNPYTASLIPPEQKQQMFNSIMNMSKGMGNMYGGSQSNAQPGLLHQLWTTITGGNNSQTSQGTSTGSSNSGYQYDTNGNNVKASPDEVNHIANYGNGSSNNVTPGTSAGGDITNQQAAIPTVGYNGPQSVAQGQTGAANNQQYSPTMKSVSSTAAVPNTTATAWQAKALPESTPGIALTSEAKGAEKGAETAGAAEASTYKDLLNSSFKQADTNQQAQRSLVAFKNDYDNATLKGAPLTAGEALFGNWIKSLDANTAAAASNGAGYVLASAQGLGPSTGKSTKYMTQLIQDAKLNPEMPVDTVNQKYPLLMTIADRAQEQNNFYKTLVGHGITNPYEMENQWFNYNQQYPLENSKGVVLRGNLNKYNEFLNNQYAGGTTNSAISSDADVDTQVKNTGEPATSNNTQTPQQSSLAPPTNLSPVAKVISQRPVPSFTSQNAFQTWFNAQPAVVQDGTRERLRLDKLAKLGNQ